MTTIVWIWQENSRAAREALRSAEEARSQFEAQVSI